MQTTDLAVINAEAVRSWGATALVALAAARDEIDALNVFPVADGDTGTNLLLTVEAAARAVAALPPGADLAATVRELARGALVGARGNSGIILSQLFRGMAGAVRLEAERGPVEADPVLLKAALCSAADAAYTAVSRPVEGTMLSVARAAADAAAEAQGDLVDVVRAAAAGAHIALARTPEQLDVLATAGVVDAGGQGLCVLFDALLAVVSGSEPPPPPRAARLSDLPAAPDRAASAPVAQGVPGFEVMFLLDTALDADEAIAPLREALDAVGDSVVVVGGEGLWSVHVHTDDVGGVLEAGYAAGRPHRVRVTTLATLPPSSSHGHSAPLQRRAVVAVVAGPGMARLAAGAGAIVVPAAESSGSGARVDEESLLAAVEGAGAPEVVVLPLNAASTAVAERVAATARTRGLRIAVVPVRASVQALAGLAVHDPERRFDDDVVAMTAAASHVRHGGVTVARQAAVTMAGPCRAGDVLGLVDNEFVLVGDDLGATALAVVERLLASGGELVTLVTGDGADADLVRVITRHLNAAHPEIDVAVHDGGQAGYPLLVGVE